MNWITHSLNRKFILATASGLLLSSLVFLLLYLQLYQSQLAEERSRTVSHIGSLLQISLENAMLKRDGSCCAASPRSTTSPPAANAMDR